MRHVALFIVLAAAAPAQAETLFTMPSVPDVTDADGWAVAVGGSLEYESEYDGSDQYGTELEPALVVQWRSGKHMAFLEGQELGWRARLDDVWLVQAGLRYEMGREESEAPELAGMGDVDDELMVMGEVRRALGDWDNWVAGRIMAGGSDIGTLGVVALGHTYTMGQPGMGIDLFAFATFASSAFINRDFGVTPEQAASTGYAVTDLDSGYRSVGISLVGRWRFGDRWQLQAEAGYEKYNNDIGASPLVLQDYESEVGVSLYYRF